MLHVCSALTSFLTAFCSLAARPLLSRSWRSLHASREAAPERSFISRLTLPQQEPQAAGAVAASCRGAARLSAEAPGRLPVRAAGASSGEPALTWHLLAENCSQVLVALRTSRVTVGLHPCEKTQLHFLQWRHPALSHPAPPHHGSHDGRSLTSRVQQRCRIQPSLCMCGNKLSGKEYCTLLNSPKTTLCRGNLSRHLGYLLGTSLTESLALLTFFFP